MLDGNVCQEAAGGMAGGAIGVEFMSSVALGWVLGVGRHLRPRSSDLLRSRASPETACYVGCNEYKLGRKKQLSIRLGSRLQVQPSIARCEELRAAGSAIRWRAIVYLLASYVQV